MYFAFHDLPKGVLLHKIFESREIAVLRYLLGSPTEMLQGVTNPSAILKTRQNQTPALSKLNNVVGFFCGSSEWLIDDCLQNISESLRGVNVLCFTNHACLPI